VAVGRGFLLRRALRVAVFKHTLPAALTSSGLAKEN
jgi:hypothetical protein